MIVAVGGQPVGPCLELLALVRQHQVGDPVTVSVIRGGQTPDQTITVTLAARSQVAAVRLPVSNQQLF